ncbi:MAG: Uma2 family endonuclease [Egibacteraceae bacterium]
MSAGEAMTETVALLRVEYEQLVEAGLLDDQRVELLDGRKAAMSPESAEHASVIDVIHDQLTDAVAKAGMRIRLGHPIALSDVDEPEPDLAVVDNREDRYRDEHPGPAHVHLVVEVAHRGLSKDLGEKATRYARAGIPDYWVVDLRRRRTTVHRDPDPLTGRYLSITTIPFGHPAEPLALPEAAVTLH